MSNNKDKSTFHLGINLIDEYAYIVRIWIFNEKKQLIHSPDTQNGGNRNYSLPAGSYIIRIGVNGQVKDNKIEFFEHKTYYLGYPDTLDCLEAPKLFSSALISSNSNYESTHDYYLNPAVKISDLITFKTRYRIKTSGVFIFLRFPDKDFYQKELKGKPYWKDFTITDRKGNFVVEFPYGCITDRVKKYDFNLTGESGYLGFTAYLKPGLYLLNFSGNNQRSIPFYIYENWYTQIFMTVAKVPLFGSLRIFISKTKQFDPTDRNHIYIDHCLNKIQNGDFTLDQNLLENIAHNKIDSPMLGLLGTYIYLSSKETKDDGLFQMIVTNLQQKILKNSSNSPDLLAVNLLSHQHYDKKIPVDQNVKTKGTPMLRIAFDTIRKAAINYPWLIPENSLNDHIAENQIFDSPYNTFTPYKSKYDNIYKAVRPILKYTQKPYNKLSRKVYKVISYKNVFNSFLDSLDPSTPQSGKAPVSRSLKKSLDNFDFQINEESEIVHFDTASYQKLINKDFVSKAVEDQSGGSWIANYITTCISDGKDFSPKQIAEQFSLPLNTVMRIMKELHLDSMGGADKFDDEVQVLKYFKDSNLSTLIELPDSNISPIGFKLNPPLKKR